jgi:[ribosomal protein S18]-alanine N-acetyltransferase
MFAIRAMDEADANAVAAWRYPGAYAFYDWTQDPDDLAGFFVFKVTADVADVGLGLRPDLTGQGLGAAFLEAGLRFAATRFGTERFTLAVAAFNRRAITVYERAGFTETERYRHRTNGADHDFVAMAR